jgi:hypothetical protein
MQEADCHPERTWVPAAGLRRWGGEAKDRLLFSPLPVVVIPAENLLLESLVRPLKSPVPSSFIDFSPELRLLPRNRVCIKLGGHQERLSSRHRPSIEESLSMNALASGSHPVLPTRRNLLVVALALVSLVSASTAFALPAHADDDPADAKPATNIRAVRLSYTEGGVQVIQDGQVVADPALANQPIFEGTQVVTGPDGQAEVQLEDGSVVRISPSASLTFSVLGQEGNNSRTEIVVNGGLVYFELQPSTPEHSLRVSYGPTSFAASSFSVVRVVADDPPANVAVFSGNVTLERGGSHKVDLHDGQSLTLNTGEATDDNVSGEIAQNSWDNWNADRDEILNSEAAEKTPATGSIGGSAGPGMSDLDANGNWYNVPDQGYVWSPYVAQSVGVGWDPYGYGHWVNYPRRGYVWVSGYGWGYAPYSCGLWNYYDNFGWGWAPGGGCGGFWGGGGGYFGGGFYGGGGGWYNIGRYPSGYRPPRRPNPGRPVRVGDRRPLNVVAVDRRAPGAQNPVAVGGPRQPVNIGGHTVEPLRPVNPRESYDRGGAGNTTVGVRNGARPGQPGHYGVDTYPGNPRPTSGLRPGGIPSGARPGTSLPSGQPAYQPGYRPSTPSGGGRPQQPSYPPPSRPAPAPRPSSGGGNPGGGHPAGGGGGGSHPSGGSPHK